MLLLNILLALVWTALTGQFTALNFLLGLALGYLAIGIGVRTRPATRYFHRINLALRFAIFFIWELVKASLRVAFDIVTPQHYMRPGVVAIPLDLKSDAQITMLANLITLTPGSLTLEVSADRKYLYVHEMYLIDPDQMRARIKEGLERRVRELVP